MDEDDTKGLSNVVPIDAGRIEDHLRQIVRGSVEETLNSLLEAEADRLCNAGRHERSEARRDTRNWPLRAQAAHARRRGAGARCRSFAGRRIDDGNHRALSPARALEEALMEMYLAGVSLRRVEDITEALWGTRVSPSTLSNLNEKLYSQIETWRNRSIEGEHPYLYLDGIVLKRSWGPEAQLGR